MRSGGLVVRTSGTFSEAARERERERMGGGGGGVEREEKGEMRDERRSSQRQWCEWRRESDRLDRVGTGKEEGWREKAMG